jgi:hypothetical protein
MDLQTLTTFFMWCTILNAALLAFPTLFLMAAGGFVYRIHSKLFPMSRDAFNVAMYSLIGLFKILFIVFSVVPYVALLIVGSCRGM